jgi:hypothetical protein
MKIIINLTVVTFLVYSTSIFGQFRNSNEELSVEIFQMAHCRVLERKATEEQVQTLVPQTANRFNVKGLVHFLVSSNEHYSHFVQGRTNGFIIRALYDHLLDRSPLPSEEMNWMQFLVRNPVQAMIDNIMNGPEYNQKWGNHLVPGHGRNGCYNHQI